MNKLFLNSLLCICIILSCIIYFKLGYKYTQNDTKIQKSAITKPTKILPRHYNMQNLTKTKKPILTRPTHPQEEFNADFTKRMSDLKEYLLKSNDALKDKLFPWLFHFINGSNPNGYTGEKNTKGIVICTGNSHIRLALVALRSLQLIENELPVEVVYSTSNDLSVDNQQIIKNLFPKVDLIDISLTSFNDTHLELRGWEIKPFAVLASRYEQVLLMDSDVLFLEKPSILFNNKYFIQTGTLFFYDRPNIPDKTIKWIKTFSSNNNEPLPIRTQEAGVVLIDKSRVFKGLLSICKLNDHHEREQFTYKYVYGDKDTWWLGLHIIQMPYSFIPTMTASIGQVDNNNKNLVSGHILHLDENHKPVWWNGGMFRNRYVNQDLLHINGWLEEGAWSIQTYSYLINNQKKAQQFSKDHQQLILGYRNITKLFFNIS
jgi:hypothetical protein